MKKDGTHNPEESRPAAEPAKVVRIPRDWFGPKEDLVPFGPSALDTSVVEPERTVERLPGRGAASSHRHDSKPSASGQSRPSASDQSKPSASDPHAPVDPNAFWGEDSGLIHNVVEGTSGRFADAAGSASIRTDHRDPSPPGLRGRFDGLPHVSRAVGTKALVATGCVALLLVASVAVWLPAGSRLRTFGASVASIGTQHSDSGLGPAEYQHIAWAAHHAGTTQATVRTRSQVRTRRSRAMVLTPRRQTAPKAAHTPPAPTDVTYHATAAASSAPASSTYQPPARPESSTVQSSGDRGGSTANAASAAATHSSPTSFGPTGALGPMSSPDG